MLIIIKILQIKSTVLLGSVKLSPDKEVMLFVVQLAFRVPTEARFWTESMYASISLERTDNSIEPSGFTVETMDII